MSQLSNFFEVLHTSTAVCQCTAHSAADWSSITAPERGAARSAHDAAQHMQITELASKRPLLPPDLGLPPALREVLDTFRIAAGLGPRAPGAYVISMASSPSDILAVVLLQKEARSHFHTCEPLCPLP